MIIGMAEITRILEAVQQGDLQAAAELVPLVYEEMRKVATQKMAREAPGYAVKPAEVRRVIRLTKETPAHAG
jgi:hypothetical protein